MNNTRFASALHILTLLADSPGEWLNSEWIAGSLNVNPVVVRKELIVLHEAGLVQSRKGKNGGSTLAKDPQKISLAEIYLAVKNSEVLGKRHAQPSPDCPIGKQINQKLTVLYQDIDQVLLKELEAHSVASFRAEFH